MASVYRLALLILCCLVAACPENAPVNPAEAPIVITPAFESSTGTIVVEVAGSAGSEVLFEGPNGLQLRLRSPAVACSMPAGKWSIRTSDPGSSGSAKDVLLGADETRRLTLHPPPEPVHPTSTTSGPGLVFDGQPLPPHSTLPLVTRHSNSKLSLTDTLAGKKLVKRRQFDGDDVASLTELQWKIRTAIIHAFRARTLEDRVQELVSKGEGRHFLIASDGQIYQVTDLANKVPVLDPYQDRTAVHIDLQFPSDAREKPIRHASGTINGQPVTAPRFTNAQHRSLKLLLRELNHHLPRIHLKTPTVDNLPSQAAIAWPRLFRGVLARFHTDAASTLPGPGLQFEEILPHERTNPFQVGESNEEALWIQGTSDKARISMTGPQGTKVVGSGTLVVCRPSRGRWRAESTRIDGSRLETHVDIGSTSLTTLDLKDATQGQLQIDDSLKRSVRVTGPNGYRQDMSLPVLLERLVPGTYRIVPTGSPRDQESPLQQWAVRVEDQETARFTLPEPSKAPASIVVAGHSFRLDDNVPSVTFESAKGYSFYRAQRQIGRQTRLYEARKTKLGKDIKHLPELSESVRMVVLHADVLDDIETAFHVLHSNGLSSHFGIDFDGTIYQMLDPIHVAYGAAEVNPISIQIDLNNRMHNLLTNPKAPPYPRDHKRRRLMNSPEYKRPLSNEIVINGKPKKTYGYTEAQYRSLASLLRTLSGAVKGLELNVPTSSLAGRHHWNDRYEDFQGIVAHYHLTPRRWDPGPGFNWTRLLKELSGQAH